MNIYILRRIDFATIENRISDAICIEDIGATDSVELAEKLLVKYRAAARTYSGWNNCEYPQFRITKLSTLNTSHVGGTCENEHAWSVRSEASATCCGKRICLACGVVDIISPTGVRSSSSEEL